MLGVQSIQITPEILQLISDIDQFKGLWRGLERHTTGLNLLGDVADYGANFKRVLGPLQQQDLTPDVIRVLHGSQIGDGGVSDYRLGDDPLDIRNDKNHTVGLLDVAAPDQIALFLSKLCEWLNDAVAEGRLHPLIIAAVFTGVFLQISPFESGNLRLVRFLVMLIVLRAGYTYAPYVLLGPIMEARADAVYAGLKHNQDSLEIGKPDWSVWILCFLGILQAQKNVLQGKLDADQKDLSHLPTLSARIMALFDTHQRLQMKEIIKLTNGRRATIKLRLGELIDAGYLRRYGQARSTWYSLV